MTRRRTFAGAGGEEGEEIVEEIQGEEERGTEKAEKTTNAKPRNVDLSARGKAPRRTEQDEAYYRGRVDEQVIEV